MGGVGLVVAWPVVDVAVTGWRHSEQIGNARTRVSRLPTDELKMISASPRHADFAFAYAVLASRGIDMKPEMSVLLEMLMSPDAQTWQRHVVPACVLSGSALALGLVVTGWPRRLARTRRGHHGCELTRERKRDGELTYPPGFASARGAVDGQTKPPRGVSHASGIIAACQVLIRLGGLPSPI